MAMPKSLKTCDLDFEDVVCVTQSQVSTPVGDEVAILGLDNAVYHGLNPVGARVWELLQTPIQVGQIHATMLAEYEVDDETARRDVVEIVQQLLEAGLIELRHEDAS